MSVVSKMNIDNTYYDIKDSLSRNPQWNEEYEPGSIPVEGEYIGTSIHKIADVLSDLSDDFATKNELSTAVTTLQTNFQAGVDKVANACIGKGSTPVEPYTPDSVADAINAISGGGTLVEKVITENGVYDPQEDDADGYSLVTVATPSREPYSMFPQEIPDWNFSYDHCQDNTNIRFINGQNVFKAHILASEDNLIKLNFFGLVMNPTSSSGSLSLVIDDDSSTTISDIGTYSFSEEDSDLTPYSLTYTLPIQLSAGYHTIALRPDNTTGYDVTFAASLFNIYGYNFSEVVNAGYYLLDGVFSIYYIPDNFINPSNPIVYELGHGGGGCGGGSMEGVDTAMNSHYTSQFDTGICFHMEGIDSSLETEELPDIEDTLVFNNGKFIYNHSTARTQYSEIFEYHYFILPVTKQFFKSFSYINIHGKLVSKTGEVNSSAQVFPFALLRNNQNRVSMSYYEEDHEYINNLSEGDEFTVTTDLHLPQSDDVSFIGFCVYGISTDDSPFILEIDKIWGSSTRQEDNN